MNRGHAAGEAEALEPTNQEIERVPVLGEDQDPLVREPRIPNHLSELVEFRFLATAQHLACQHQELLHLASLGLQLGQRRGHHASENLFLGQLVLLAPALGALLVPGTLIERITGLQPALECQEVLD